MKVLRERYELSCSRISEIAAAQEVAEEYKDYFKKVAEVKSLRAGNCNLKESFCFIRNGQLTLKNAHIAVYDKAGAFSTKESKRDRRLLISLIQSFSILPWLMTAFASVFVAMGAYEVSIALQRPRHKLILP